MYTLFGCLIDGKKLVDSAESCPQLVSGSQFDFWQVLSGWVNAHGQLPYEVNQPQTRQVLFLMEIR